jgi:hypothetical protein
MYKQAVRGYAAFLILNGLQGLFFPQWQWEPLGFFPKGTPAGNDQWLMTVRILSAYLIAIACTIFRFPGEGVLAAGIGMLGALLWHKSFGFTFPSFVCVANIAVGCFGSFLKYANTASRMFGAPVLKSEIVHAVHNTRDTVMKAYAGFIGLVGLQHLLLPSLAWTFCFPSGTPTNNFMVYTVRCVGVVLLCLSAKLLHFPDAVALAMGGVGILGCNVWHGNLSVNPPNIMTAVMLSLGAYGLISGNSIGGGALSPSARARRSMPIPGRVQ